MDLKNPTTQGLLTSLIFFIFGAPQRHLAPSVMTESCELPILVHSSVGTAHWNNFPQPGIDLRPRRSRPQNRGRGWTLSRCRIHQIILFSAVFETASETLKTINVSSAKTLAARAHPQATISFPPNRRLRPGKPRERSQPRQTRRSREPPLGRIAERKTAHLPHSRLSLRHDKD